MRVFSLVLRQLSRRFFSHCGKTRIGWFGRIVDEKQLGLTGSAKEQTDCLPERYQLRGLSKKCQGKRGTYLVTNDKTFPIGTPGKCESIAKALDLIDDSLRSHVPKFDDSI